MTRTHRAPAALATLLAGALWIIGASSAQAQTSGNKWLDCGTTTGQQVQCPTDGYATSVRIGREVSRNVCRQGHNWGHTDSFIWANGGCHALFVVSIGAPQPAPPNARVITCGNPSGAEMQCPMRGFVSDVELLRDLGRSRCREGYNWWHNGAVITTQGGCRGEFELAHQSTMPPPTTRLIECGSPSGGQDECKTDGDVISVRVERQRGAVRCRQGTNWGHTRSFIWANKGCYAVFEATYAGAPSRPRPPAPAQRVIQCGNRNGAAMSCNAFGPVAEVRVLREYSNGRCRFGHGWGKEPGDVWVKNGCFADFEVSYLAPQPR
ncbi:MAG: DUF3011 domain-containing protein [Pseudomonadota bacterium]